MTYYFTHLPSSLLSKLRRTTPAEILWKLNPKLVHRVDFTLAVENVLINMYETVPQGSNAVVEKRRN
jgi:hypothetical protein